MFEFRGASLRAIAGVPILVKALGGLNVTFVRNQSPSWLVENIKSPAVLPPSSAFSDQIERQARSTERLGSRPLWDGYTQQGTAEIGTRRQLSSSQVRTSRKTGNFFTWLVAQREPSVIVEFGTAFGVSGMFWLAGLELNRKGELLTFEPNEVWADIAKDNLSAISTRFTAHVGTFEDNIDSALGTDRTIDIAFIDAIHTSEFVIPQLDMVMQRLSPGGIVVLDDIDFSADMEECWQAVSADSRFVASVVVGRVGVLEHRADT